MKMRLLSYTGYFLIIPLLPTLVFGQANSGTVSGRVLDSANRPVRLATVGIYAAGNSTGAIRQVLADSAGRYSLSADTGNYVLKISASGMAGYTRPITLKAGERMRQDAVLFPLAHRLKTVTVKTSKALIEQGEDKVIYNVENDPAAKTESASDLLRKTPFVIVDGEGNVQVNGQSNFKILLNGRQTSLFARNVKEALKSFPGAVISKIEVITSPSAKYDAEGSGGIINIITKKRLAGYHVALTSSYSTLNKYSESASVNAKWGKLGVSASISTGGYTRGVRSFSYSETTPVGIAVFSKRTLDGEKNHRSRNGYASLELAYDFDSLNTVAVYGSIDRYRSTDLLARTIFVESLQQQARKNWLNGDEVYRNPGGEMGADWIRKFPGQPEKELSFRFLTQVYKDDEIANSLQTTGTFDRFVFNTSAAKSREQTYQLDYVHPLPEKSKIETGAKAIIRSASSNYQSLVRYDKAEAYRPDPFNTDQFRYRQAVYSLYASYSLRRKKNSLRAGVRMEHTVVNGRFISTKSQVRQEYTNLVPALLLSRKFTAVYTLSASYNLRLYRPSINSLNPFVNNADSLNISFGNPELEPQLLHSFSLQNRFSSGKFFAALGLNASYSNNMVVQYASFNRETGITSITRANIGVERQAALFLNVNTPLGERVAVSINSQLRYNKVKNKFSLLKQREGLSGSLSGNIRCKLTGGFSVGGSGGVSRSPYALVNSPAAQYYYQVTVAQKLLDDKLALTLTLNNFHDQYFGYKTVTEDPDFRIVSVNTNPFRVIQFGITYNFGKLKEEVSKKKGVENDDKEQ